MPHSTLTGVWSGAYRYPGDVGPETVFNVQIEEIGGGFIGAMQEPNLLRPDLGPVASADIEGVRNGAQVSFAKFYDGSGGMAHAVQYDGNADAALMRIEGAWTIPGIWSGTFFMVRDDDGAAEKIELEVEATAGHELSPVLLRLGKQPPIPGTTRSGGPGTQEHRRLKNARRAEGAKQRRPAILGPGLGARAPIREWV